MTAFNGGLITVADEETGQPEAMPVTAGTVILDTSLTGKRNTARLRFTAMHEGAHWMIHREAFAVDNPFGPVGAYENQYLAAKEGRIDYNRSHRERTDIERIERQADFLAAALLMPRPALREAYRTFFRFYGEKPRRIIKGSSPMDDCFARELPEYVAQQFSVSKRAALIRLEKLTAIVDDKTWRGARPTVAYRRVGQADLAGRKLIKCPYCREALTDVERNTTVHIYRRKSKKFEPIPGQMFKMCDACKAEVDIILIAG